MMGLSVVLVLAWWVGMERRPLWPSHWVVHRAKPEPALRFAFYPATPQSEARHQHLVLQLPLLADHQQLLAVKRLCQDAKLPLRFSQVWQHGQWWYSAEVGPYPTLAALYQAHRQLRQVGLVGRLQRVS